MQVKTNKKASKAMQCALNLTANAKKGIAKFFDHEQAFFASEKFFAVAIEKRNENRQGNLSFSIYFDNVQNENISEKLNGRVAVMECIIQNDGFLATGFHVRGTREPVVTNRRHIGKIKFVLNQQTAAQMPIELYIALRELPVAEERSAYVEKRIASWEGYLRIQEMNADVEDITATYKTPSLSEDFSKVQLVCQELNRKTLRKIDGFSAKIDGMSIDLGNVVHVNPSRNMIEIELSPRAKNDARRHALNLHQYKKITFNNFAELSQVRRLRRGFKDLQDGLAANPNLEKILFEERPVVQISNQQQALEFHSRLNKFQQEAVTGAMNAHDLYVIQGPPGTGKTTVISEICYQNAKAGLRTLVASQANLAVDNALGRLLDDQDIRILRYGRTESIEEEGKKFIEENVAHYWKEQTIDAIEQALKQHKERKHQLEREVAESEKHLGEANEALVVTEQKIEAKQRAVQQHETFITDYDRMLAEQTKLSDRKTALNEKQQRLEENQETLVTTINQLKEQLQQVEEQLKEASFIEEIKTQLAQVKTAIQYKEIIEQEEKLTAQYTLLEQEQVEKQARLQKLEQFLQQSLFVSKLTEFQTLLTTSEIDIPQATNAKITTLNHLILKIKAHLSNGTNDVWHVLEERIQKALPILENILTKQKYSSQLAERYVSRQVMAPERLKQSLDATARFLQNPQTKQLLSTRHYSPERYDALENLARTHAIFKLQRDMIRTQYLNIHVRQQMENESKQLFESVKRESVETANQFADELTNRLGSLSIEVAAAQEELVGLRESLSTLEVPVMEESLAVLRDQHRRLQSEYEANEEKQEMIHMSEKSIVENEHAVEEVTADMKKTTTQLAEKQQEISRLTAALQENEKKRDALREQLDSQPEEEKAALVQKIEQYNEKIAKNKTECAQLPMKEALQQQWLSMLENATAYDLEEIKKMYIEHANVIGTTCVASARRDFMEDYPTFDVVIIDEVSKATPPELLLPMLKGKKIILVGDHHQLPPLIGQETMEEFLAESASSTEKKELEQLLKESLFERLFRTLPKQNKTMLAIQYRMHEKIMATITPFYNEENYALQCGIENSDAERNHLLRSGQFNESNHLLWFDMPNEPSYFEARVKGGTSRYNEAELAQIRTLLMELNEATERAINEGKLPIGAKKKIGVISFYGEQVKRIERLIAHELQLPHLHCRTGSVDKFQGMEMDVIILSFVRNHDHPRGDIGFAQDYRRLNVALSRARELLMIVGSADMFTKRPKNDRTKKMFTHLLDQVKAQDGWIRSSKEVT